MTNRYIQCLVVVLALACMPIPLYADPYQIAPNPNYGTIDIITGDDATNNQIFRNYSRIYIYSNGTLSNYDVMQNNDSLSNSGTLNNSGMLYNIGTLENVHSGTLNNSGTLEIFGSGTLENSGTLNNSAKLNIMSFGEFSGDGQYYQYAGQTIVDAMASITQGLVDIQGGILQGNGSVTSSKHFVNGGGVRIGAGATVAPGPSLGALTTIGDFSSSGKFEFEIAGLGLGLYDVLDINGDAVFNGGTMQFDFIDEFNASVGNYWDFILANTFTGWATLSFTVNGLGEGLAWQIVGDTGDTYRRLLITADGGGETPVPEPSTMLLLGSGLAGLVGYGRRRFKK